ncbi:MAG: hypothetical protein ABSF45_16070 [Terriglobia bacterium]|jgi:hypothetical protein
MGLIGSDSQNQHLYMTRYLLFTFKHYTYHRALGSNLELAAA